MVSPPLKYSVGFNILLKTFAEVVDVGRRGVLFCDREILSHSLASFFVREILSHSLAFHSR